MSQDLMNYDKMTQLALRGVVRDAIRRVLREDGLPGAHHFYITFLTRFPGVDIDEALAKKYEEEITVVLEHQYWDLVAADDHFEVTLKFGGVPKYLSVPYTAITRFHDPSVGFAMQFDPPEEMQDQPPAVAHLKPAPLAPVPVAEIKPEPAPKKPKKTAPKIKAEPAPVPIDDVVDDDDGPDDGGDDGNKIVSLDAFRKK